MHIKTNKDFKEYKDELARGFSMQKETQKRKKEEVEIAMWNANATQEVGGSCFGLNRTTNRLIIGDRKKLKNPHGIIIGRTGCGKSMNIKMEMAQDLLRDDIAITDPQNDFKAFTEEF